MRSYSSPSWLRNCERAALQDRAAAAAVIGCSAISVNLAALNETGRAQHTYNTAASENMDHRDLYKISVLLTGGSLRCQRNIL